jgi:chromate transporter
VSQIKGDPITPAYYTVPLAEAARVWTHVALTSFGGPAAQIAIMHRLIVEEKRWIGEQRFLQALNFCMLLPGPEAQQLATYLGWLLNGVRGGLIAGLLFILPSAVAIMGLSLIYAALGHVGLVQGLFFGLKAAVLAIVVDALLRIGRRALKTAPTRVLAGTAFIGIFFLDLPFPLIILGTGFFGYLATRLGFGLGLNGAQGAAEPASALGEETPEHTQPSLPRALKTAAIWLTLWLAPVALLFLLRGPGDVFTQILFLEDGRGRIRRRLWRAHLCGADRRRNLPLADARPDARRPRHDGDDARPDADGSAIRRLHGRIS